MEQTIISAFREASVRHASAPAVTDGAKKYTYLELADLSARIAGHLSATGEERDARPIGLFLAQTADVVPAMLGVLRSGNMYVPLDRHFPSSRLCTIVSDAGIRQILTTADLVARAREIFAGVEIAYTLLEDALHDEVAGQAQEPGICPEDNAYILYTSGTTGKPKGIYQSHGNVVHHCTRFGDLVRIKENDTIALTTSFSHCVAVIDIFSVLFKGGCVAVYDFKANTDLLALKAFISENKITIIHTIPSLFRAAFETVSAGGVSSVRLVVLGGEDVHARDFELFRSRFSSKTVFANLYGSTELIIATACLLNMKSTVSRTRIPAGYPMEGVTYRIVNENNEPQGLLAIGEIEFQSGFLSPGYKDAGLNGSNLVSDPAAPGMRKYKSGDLGRILPDGTLELMGRADTQIKINGNRIELLEIEAAADSFPGMEKAIIKAFDRTEFEKFIVCFYKSSQVLEANVLREYLNKMLPAYMLPEQWVAVEDFPKTATGKIDRAAIRLDQASHARQDNDFTGDGEQEVANMWSVVLEHSNFGPQDAFLIVGGNSLKLSQLHLMINELYPDTVSVQDLFDHSSVRSMAKLIAERSSAEAVVAEVSSDIEI